MGGAHGEAGDEAAECRRAAASGTLAAFRLGLRLADCLGEELARGAHEFVAELDGEDEAFGFELVQVFPDCTCFGFRCVNPLSKALA